MGEGESKTGDFFQCPEDAPMSHISGQPGESAWWEINSGAARQLHLIFGERSSYPLEKIRYC